MVKKTEEEETKGKEGKIQQLKKRQKAITIVVQAETEKRRHRKGVV